MSKIDQILRTEIHTLRSEVFQLKGRPLELPVIRGNHDKNLELIKVPFLDCLKKKMLWLPPLYNTILLDFIYYLGTSRGKHKTS